MLRKINHIGIATHRIENSVRPFRHLFGLDIRTLTLEQAKLNIAFVTIGDTMMEYLEPYGDEEVFTKFLREHGEGVHHIAFEVENVAQAIQIARDNGIEMEDLVPRKGADGLIAFVKHPMTGITFEFLQVGKGE